MSTLRRNWDLYLLASVPVFYFIVFQYAPLYGNVIAFKAFVPSRGILRSEWVGLHQFRRFFAYHNASGIILNTFHIAVYELVAGFPIPIIVSLSLNYVHGRRWRNGFQTILSAPHFISVVVMAGMIVQFLSPRFGIIAQTMGLLGVQLKNPLGQAGLFSSIYVWSGIWQHTGWETIIYVASLASVDPQLHESAVVDGASVLQRIRYVDLPGILPTAAIVFIVNCGRVLHISFEKILLLQNPLNLSASEVIHTYVYKVGFSSDIGIPNFSYAAAVDLMRSVLSLLLIIAANHVTKRLTEWSLW